MRQAKGTASRIVADRSDRRPRWWAMLAGAAAVTLLCAGCAPDPTPPEMRAAAPSSVGTDAAAESTRAAIADLRRGLDVATTESPETGRAAASIADEMLAVLDARLVEGAVDAETALGYAHEIERRVSAGEDPSTGSSFSQAGVDVPTVTSDPLPFAEHDTFAQSFMGEPDAAGSFLRAAAELASALGVQLMFFDANTSPPCGVSEDYGAAYYTMQCGVDASIWVNRARDTYVERAMTGDALAVIRHELAHYELAVRCYPGAVFDPDIPLEAVTSSYAVLFLGADPAPLEAIGAEYPDYAMDERTDALALELHERTPERAPTCAG